MIWARWRGGNLLRTAHAGFVQQESLPAALLVAAADSPNGARITLQPISDGPDGFTGGDGKDDAGMLDLEPSKTPRSGNPSKDGKIRGSNNQGARFPAAHRSTSYAEADLYLQHTAPSNFLRDFMPGPLGQGFASYTG